MYFDNQFITINQRSQLRCEFFVQYAKWNEYATNKQERFSVSIMEKARETKATQKESKYDISKQMERLQFTHINVKITEMDLFYTSPHEYRKWCNITL